MDKDFRIRSGQVDRLESFSMSFGLPLVETNRLKAECGELINARATAARFVEMPRDELAVWFQTVLSFSRADRLRVKKFLVGNAPALRLLSWLEQTLVT